jgi:hypothetical protein
MNSPLRKLPAISLVLVLLANILTATQDPIRVWIYSEYGMITEASKPSILMTTKIFADVPPEATVRSLRQSRLLFRVAGGIMLDAVGQPCNQLATKRLNLGYDVRRAKGKRLVLRVDNRVYSVAGVDDRDLRAIAEFAENENPVVVNVANPPINAVKSCPNPEGLQLVKTHDAFAKTRLGWLLTRMDTIAWSFRDGERWATDDPLPDSTLTLSRQLKDTLDEDYKRYAESQRAEQRKLIAKGPAALAQLSSEDQKEINQRFNSIGPEAWEPYEKETLNTAAIDSKAFNKLSKTDRRKLLLRGTMTGQEIVSNINDAESEPGFCVANSTLVFDGIPKLEFFRRWYDTTYRFRGASDLMSSNFSQLRLIDQEAYDATMEIYNLSGLFRYVKNQQPNILWKGFVKSLPPKSQADYIEIACPQCTRGQVTDWLACLAAPN